MNTETIMDYLKDTFNFEYSNSFVRNTFINVIEYGIENFNHSENQLAEYLSNMFDELEFDEIKSFIHRKNYDMSLDEIINSMNDNQIRYTFSKIKELKNSNPEIENTSEDPSDRWDLFDILEYHCLKNILDTDRLVDDYDDATGRLEYMDFSDYINYYEDKQFGKWEYKIEKGCYLEIPVLKNDDYKNNQEYIEYRTNLERDFLLSLEDSDLKWKEKYINIIYDVFEKVGFDKMKSTIQKQELDISNLINNYKVPLVIEEYIDYSDEDLSNDLYLKNIPCDSRDELVYCDNDICYYDCHDGDYIYIDTREATGLMEDGITRDNGVVRVSELAVNYLFVDCNGADFKKELADKYMRFDSIKGNCYIKDEFKDEILSDYTNNSDLSYVKECVDYSVLEEHLNQDELEKIDDILNDFSTYQSKYDDGDIDIIGQYTSKYGNSNVIEWYEGMKTTESFIEDFILYERVDEYEK